jgi:hypothetical protein
MGDLDLYEMVFSGTVGLFHLYRQAALKELKYMIGQDLLMKEGLRKSAHYTLK